MSFPSENSASPGRAARAPRVVPFELYGDLIYVRVAVGGLPAELFIVDTGASLNCLDAGWASHLPTVPVDAVLGGAGGAGGETPSISIAQAPPLLLEGGAESPAAHVALFDLEPIRRAHGRPLRGILGYDFFAGRVVVIDYEKRILELHQPETPSDVGSGELLEIDLESRVPVATATLPDGTAAKVVLDTGAAGIPLRLTRRFAERHPAFPATSPEVPVGIGTGGVTRGRLTRTDFRLGRLPIFGAVASVATDVSGYFAASQHDGDVGAAFLSRCRLVIDYPRRHFILQPGPRFGDPYDYDMTGMLFLAEGAGYDRYRVAEVLPGAPAALAGIRAGDEITAIDRRAVTGFTAYAVKKALQTEGVSHEIGIRRDSRQLTLKLTPRRLV
jgi:hypothetical protein